MGDLFVKPASGATAEELLLHSDESKTVHGWSPDGRFLVYVSQGAGNEGDLWILPMEGDHTPWVFLKTPFRESYPAFSPDGRWMAYQSNESGRPEVPPSRDALADKPGGQWQVSTAGGIVPAWRPDGKELFYLDPAGAMMAAPITVTGSTPDLGTPVRLFPTRIAGRGEDVQQGRQYDVTRDGRFLINTELSGADAPITLLQNWRPEAK